MKYRVQQTQQHELPANPIANSESDPSTNEAVNALRDLLRLLARGIANRWIALQKAKRTPIDSLDDDAPGDIESTGDLARR